MKTPAGGPGRKVEIGNYQDLKITRFPTPRPRRRDGLVGLHPRRTPGELVRDAVAQLEKEAHLREAVGTPDPWLRDLAAWLRAGGRHSPREWTATP